MRIGVVGDCLFDVSVRASLPLEPGSDTPADVELVPGGQAANVAVRAARRGAAVRLITPLANDAAGRLLQRELAGEGVDVVALPAERTGLVVAVVDRSGERTMLSSRTPFPRGVTARHELARQLASCDWVHASGYALLDPHGGEAVAGAIGALPARIRRSADAASLPAADGSGARQLHERLASMRADLVFAGRREAALLLDRPGVADEPLDELAGALARRSERGVIVTGGADGSAAAVASIELTVPAYAAHAAILDSTGAGDAFAAAVIVELGRGGWPPSAGELRAAMLVGGEVGSRVTRVRGAQSRVLGEAEPAEASAAG